MVCKGKGKSAHEKKEGPMVEKKEAMMKGKKKVPKK